MEAQLPPASGSSTRSTDRRTAAVVHQIFSTAIASLSSSAEEMTFPTHAGGSASSPDAAISLEGMRCSSSSRFRVALIAPHPDDFDILAATMALFAEHPGGCDIRVCVLSCGSGVEDSFCTETRGVEPTPQAIRKIRRGEQQAGCNFFEEKYPGSVTLKFLELEESGAPDYAYATRGQTLLTPVNFDAFALYLSEVDPDVVMLPAVYETLPAAEPSPMPGGPGNAGHYRCGKLVEEALRRSGRPTALLQHGDPKTVSMRHDLFTPYDAETREWKAEMLRLHESQHVRNLETRGVGFDSRILAPELVNAKELAGARWEVWVAKGVAGVEVFQLDFVNC